MKNTWISQEDEQQRTLLCKFCEKHDEVETPAIALEGQWAGGDEDVDPQWVPVCGKHQIDWHTNHGYKDSDADAEEWIEPIPAESRLGTVRLGDPNGDGFFGVDATALVEQIAKGEYERVTGGHGSPWSEVDANVKRGFKQDLLPVITATLRAYEES